MGMATKMRKETQRKECAEAFVHLVPFEPCRRHYFSSKNYLRFASGGDPPDAKRVEDGSC
jgi:hypothetical protein